jgi:hypothetical protein
MRGSWCADIYNEDLYGILVGILEKLLSSDKIFWKERKIALNIIEKVYKKIIIEEPS